MSEVESQVAQMENYRDQQKALLAKRQEVQKLMRNREFRKVILEDFMVTEAARYAQESGDPALSPEQRADALALAQASGHLKRYLNIVLQMGAYAERELPNIEDGLDQARAEESNE